MAKGSISEIKFLDLNKTIAMPRELTAYEQWQIEKYGNILPSRGESREDDVQDQVLAGYSELQPEKMEEVC